MSIKILIEGVERRKDKLKQSRKKFSKNREFAKIQATGLGREGYLNLASDREYHGDGGSRFSQRILYSEKSEGGNFKKLKGAKFEQGEPSPRRTDQFQKNKLLNKNVESQRKIKSISKSRSSKSRKSSKNSKKRSVKGG
jgi:hypothetical protein